MFQTKLETQFEAQHELIPIEKRNNKLQSLAHLDKMNFY